MIKHKRYTITEVKEINQRNGHYFFSRDTLRFFGNTMKDFRVVHVDLPNELQEVYVTAHNHNAPHGCAKVSVYRFNPTTGDISHVNLKQAQVLYMRKWHMSLAEFESAVNLIEV